MSLETANNPMSLPQLRLSLMRQAPRCGARNRAGKPCQCPRMKDKRRCRLHGGAHGSGAPRGARNGNYRHGLGTRESIAELRAFREALREWRSAVF